MKALSGMALVGDIGGTNARLALCNLEDGTLSTPIIYSALENDSLESCILKFRQETHYDFKSACIAIACPITGDYVKMTNNPWEFSQQQLKNAIGLDDLIVINDFTAMSMSVPCLDKKHVVKIGGGESDPHAPIAVYGAGTGLGVAHLVHIGNQWISLPGEGGHVDLAPANMAEDLILLTMRARIGHVSAERVLSGPGLVNLYEAIAMRNERLRTDMSPADVTSKALSNPPDPDCLEALETFCRMMGHFGGNLALTMGTFGGVYIAGGVVPRFIEFFKQSKFRDAFEDKGRFRGYMERIPTYVITDTKAGLRGAGATLRQALGAIL
ncbi:MAG: glucokinase [Candidatus Anaerobiospirillum merdipullorum]|uniref:Glucokinase n=1 Tax=Candidatus Anaerobiospirillum merdipullorum TaxID=2838450 RepID=A0A9E2NS63_9GAMM|nr:glucokinase [Candidatus Anaerobiospirillum merdipullorum]